MLGNRISDRYTYVMLFYAFALLFAIASTNAKPKGPLPELNKPCKLLFEQLDLGYRLEFTECKGEIVSSGTLKNPEVLHTKKHWFYVLKRAEGDEYMHFTGITSSISRGNPTCSGRTLSYRSEISGQFVIKFGDGRIDWVLDEKPTAVVSKGSCVKATRISSPTAP